MVSGRFDYSPRTDTAGTDPCLSHSAGVGDHADSLQVGEPASSRLVMCVGYIVPGNGTLPANLTYLGHFLLLISLSHAPGRWAGVFNYFSGYLAGTWFFTLFLIRFQDFYCLFPVEPPTGQLRPHRLGNKLLETVKIYIRRLFLVDGKDRNEHVAAFEPHLVFLQRRRQTI